MIDVNLEVTAKFLESIGFEEISINDVSLNQPFLNKLSLFYLLTDKEEKIGHINYSRAWKLILRKNDSPIKYDDAVYIGHTPNDSALDLPKLMISFDDDKCYICDSFSNSIIMSAAIYLRDEADSFEHLIKKLESLRFENYKIKD